MKSNNILFLKVQHSLKENESQKERLQKHLHEEMSSYINVSDLQNICKSLTQDKLNLFNKNLEIRQQHKLIQEQSKSEKKKMERIQQRLEKILSQMKEKDEIIKNNQKEIDGLKKSEQDLRKRVDDRVGLKKLRKYAESYLGNR